MGKKPIYYAYLLLSSGKSGIASNWAECEKLVKGKDARYRGFNTESSAQSWLDAGAQYEVKEKKPIPKLKKGIYFDAGTGRGQGVEVKVTDEKGKSLFTELMPQSELTKFDTYHVGKSKTNNYGELLGCYFALKIALKKKIKKVFGDSRLVVEFWSRGFFNKKKVQKDTKELAEKVAVLREKFEDIGGRLEHISGDHNPADLGFHR